MLAKKERLLRARKFSARRIPKPQSGSFYTSEEFIARHAAAVNRTLVRISVDNNEQQGRRRCASISRLDRAR